MKTPHIGDSHMHAETLGNALELFCDQHRRDILDRLGCYLHNEGYTLKGNTERHDVLWLAKTMAAKARHCAYNDWDRYPQDVRNQWLHASALAISCLPALCDRIASRYVHAAVAVRSLEEMSRACPSPKFPKED